MKAPELGIRIGVFEHGRRNSISDVKGVKVGHVTLIQGEGKLVPGKGPVRTGVTAIIPHDGNIYKEKLLANAFVMNGYAKPVGLIQVQELGTLETPIILTNTLSIGTAADALIDYMLEQNEDIGVTTGSVNPVVMECNDSYLNDIRGKHVKREHVLEAIKNAKEDFEEGAVGAGTGMSAFEFKGGIGSSSRVVDIEGRKYTVGALVLSNFGKREDLTIAGVPVGLELKGWPGKGGEGKHNNGCCDRCSPNFKTAVQGRQEGCRGTGENRRLCIQWKRRYSFCLFNCAEDKTLSKRAADHRSAAR